MKPFKSKTVRIGGSLYVLIPSDAVRESNIQEGEHYQVEMTPLVPATEVRG